jgi:hypothetical protein
MALFAVQEGLINEQRQSERREIQTDSLRDYTASQNATASPASPGTFVPQD